MIGQGLDGGHPPPPCIDPRKRDYRTWLLTH